MWNKTYSAILALATFIMGILLYFQYGWLQSKTAPKDVIAQYEFYSNISWMFLLISSVVLLIAGVVVLWKTHRTWAMWASLLYFAIFMIAHTFWLENSFFKYKQANTPANDIISWSPLVGVILIVLAAIIVFFSQYLVKRMNEKMYPAEAPLPENLAEEASADEKNL